MILEKEEQYDATIKKVLAFANENFEYKNNGWEVKKEDRAKVIEFINHFKQSGFEKKGDKKEFSRTLASVYGRVSYSHSKRKKYIFAIEIWNNGNHGYGIRTRFGSLYLKTFAKPYNGKETTDWRL